MCILMVKQWLRKAYGVRWLYRTRTESQGRMIGPRVQLPQEKQAAITVATRYGGKRCQLLRSRRVSAGIPLADYLPSRMGKPYPHWSVTIGFPSLTKNNISRLKLLLNCSGLEADVCRFRSLTSMSNVCKLCKSGPEDAQHVISYCSVLAPARDAFDLPPPLASVSASDPVQFSALILGTDGINDVCVQHACIEFIHHLQSAREQLLQSLPTSSTSAQTYGYSPSVVVTKKEKKKRTPF